jgi:methylated-DNA-protein-cysteine methyltransferase-like protein
MEKDKYGFFENVWDVARQIPEGRLTSYGAIAEYLGSKKSARMVGWAMNSCPADVPAQRVLNRNGLLTGAAHFPPERPMDKVLEAEGVKVVDNQAVDFKELFWDPRELEL